LHAQQEKQDTVITQWPQFASVISWLIPKRRLQGAVFTAHYQEKPRCSLEVDSKAHVQKESLKRSKIEGFIVDKTRSGLGLLNPYCLGLQHGLKTADSRNNHIQAEKHVCSGQVCCRLG
jgi:hypothetical protein